MPLTASMNPDNKIPLPLPDLDLVFVQGGDFLMGSEDIGASDWEKPVHPVTVPSFYIAQFPVTQALWKAVMGNNPSLFNAINALWNRFLGTRQCVAKRW